MNDFKIPYIGEVSTANFSVLFAEDQYPYLKVSGNSLYIRFSVRVQDDGLEGLNIHAGDYLIFTQTGWPMRENTTCLIRFGDEVIIRSICEILDTEPMLCTTGDRYPSFRRHRNEFVVQGQLIGRISPECAEWIRYDPQVESWEF